MSFLEEIQDELESLGIWPEGDYDFVVVKTADGETDTEKKTLYIQMKLKAIRGEYKNRVLSHTEWLSQRVDGKRVPNYWSIKRLEAFGTSPELSKARTLEDYIAVQTAELRGKQIRGKVYTDTYEGIKNSKIRTFYPIGRMKEAPSLDIDETDEIEDFTNILDEEESF